MDYWVYYNKVLVIPARVTCRVGEWREEASVMDVDGNILWTNEAYHLTLEDVILDFIFETEVNEYLMAALVQRVEIDEDTIWIYTDSNCVGWNFEFELED